MVSDAYEDIGKLLHDARESLGISEQEASRALHIRLHYIEALEAGNLSELPGVTYAKGYIQRYADYLSLDKDLLVERFEAIAQELQKKPYFLPQEFHAEKRLTRPMILAGVGIVIVAYLLWWVLQPSKQVVSIVEPYISNLENAFDDRCGDGDTSLYGDCNASGTVAPPKNEDEAVLPWQKKTPQAAPANNEIIVE